METLNRYAFFAALPPMEQNKRRQIQWAYFLAKKMHAEQKRDDGERYFEHVRGVAKILIDAGYTDAEDIVLAILHDTLEDTYMSVSMLEQLFGPTIARGVLAVSKSYGLEDPLTGFITHSQKRSKEEYFAGIHAYGERAARAKCADRLHNLSDLVEDHGPESRWTPEKRMKQVEETREWILPLADKYEKCFAERLRHLCNLIELKAKIAIEAKEKKG